MVTTMANGPSNLLIAFFPPSCLLSLLLLGATIAQAQDRPPPADWVVFPEQEWKTATPEEAGLNVEMFRELLPCINSFPIINVFQVHSNQEGLRHPAAQELGYYLRARKTLEGIFSGTSLRPRPWENYRSLWFLKFGEEILGDIRTPD